MGREIAIIYAILDAILIVLSLIIGKNWLINTQISFFCTLLIAFTTYRAYKNRVQDELMSGKFDDIDEVIDDEDEEKKYKISGVGTFFSPLKLLSYGLLALSFYLLVKFNLISPIAFFVGAIPMPLGAFIYGAFYGRN